MEITIGQALDRILERCGEQEADLYQGDGMCMSILIRWAADLQALAPHLDGDLDEILKKSRAWNYSLSKGKDDTGSRKLSEEDLTVLEEDNYRMDASLHTGNHYS